MREPRDYLRERSLPLPGIGVRLRCSNRWTARLGVGGAIASSRDRSATRSDFGSGLLLERRSVVRANALIDGDGPRCSRPFRRSDRAIPPRAASRRHPRRRVRPRRLHSQLAHRAPMALLVILGPCRGRARPVAPLYVLVLLVPRHVRLLQRDLRRPRRSGRFPGLHVLLLLCSFIGAEINDVLYRHRDTGRLRKHDGDMRGPAED
jgi:hypothetical protein